MKILITGGNGNIAKMIKNNLSSFYTIMNMSHQELDVLNLYQLESFLQNNNFDILIHTAIIGGRRTKEENGDVVYKNLLMLENLLKFSDHFKMILNFDSGAIYDRSTDIFNRKEDEIITIPTDYYGFSKYLIYKRSLSYDHFFNLRIFNIFHHSEEPDRFIKSCFLAKKNNTKITIFNNKYFDFVFEDDFISIIKYYCDNYNNINKLIKTINVCYESKYTLYDIAQMIIPEKEQIIIVNNELNSNYTGNCELLNGLNLDFIGLKNGLHLYEQNMMI